MLCDDVRRTAYFFLDGSLAEARRRDLEIHLTLCPDCEARVVIHRRIRSFFRRRLTPLTAPETLRVRITRSLHSPAAE